MPIQNQPRLLQIIMMLQKRILLRIKVFKLNFLLFWHSRNKANFYTDLQKEKIEPDLRVTIVKSVIIVIILLATIKLYLQSLIRCPSTNGNFENWIQWYTAKLPYIIPRCTFVGCSFGLLIISIYKEIIHRFWAIPLLITMWALFAYDMGNSPAMHGQQNQTLVVTLIWIVFIITAIVEILSFIWKKSKLVSIGIIIFFVMTPYVFYKYRLHNSCDMWEYGFTYKIENDIGECRIENPTYWELKIRQGLNPIIMFDRRCEDLPNKFDSHRLPPALKNRKLKTLGI